MRLLEDLVSAAHRRAADIVLPAETCASRASFADALRGKDSLSLIAEFKRRSPSRGAIAVDLDVVQQVQSYATHGAAAISVLTEPEHFGGSYDDLRAAASTVDLPILMKDFVVSPVQVRLAARIGASAVLLIGRCLDDHHLQELIRVAHDEGLDALVECHCEADIAQAIGAGAHVLGINNRDLDTLRIDRTTAPGLARHIPQDRITVAESGYETPDALGEVRGHADAVLVGTALMRGDAIQGFVRP